MSKIGLMILNIFDRFLDNAENPMLVCGAIKLLVNILFDNKDFSKSFEILDKAKSLNLTESQS